MASGTKENRRDEADGARDGGLSVELRPDQPVALSWRDWFPDLELPPGLTFEDVQRAAALVDQWVRGFDEDSGEGDDDAEWSPIPLVVRIYRQLSAADTTRRCGT